MTALAMKEAMVARTIPMMIMTTLSVPSRTEVTLSDAFSSDKY